MTGGIREGAHPATDDGNGDRILLLHEEQVEISKRSVRGDTVRVRTVTTETERRIEEPLTRTRVEITRIPVGRVVDAVPEVREEGDLTIVPVVEEEIVVQRRLVLREEIHLRRITTGDVHTETIRLRRQDAVVTRFQADPAPEQPTNQGPSE